MSTLTVYSAAAGDGDVTYQGGFGGTWANTRSGSGGSATARPTTTRGYGCESDNGITAFASYTNAHGYLVFDTSALGSGATITGVTLSVYCYAKATGAGGNVCLVSNSQASNSTLATSDYGNVGSTEYMDRTTALGGSATTFANLTTGAYNTFTLNAAGLAAINKTGYTNLAFRTSFDVDNSAPGSSAVSYMAISFSDQTGTSEDPYLTITYTSSLNENRSTSDLWAWSDSIVASRVTRTTSDAWAWSDTATQVRLRNRTTSDSWAWTDVATIPRLTSDTWAWSDTASRLLKHLYTINVYPTYDAQQANVGSSSWSTMRSASTGTSVDDTSTIQTMCQASDNGAGTRTLVRGAYIFDFSSLPSSWTVTSATFNVYRGTGSSSAGGSIGITAATWSNPTTTSEFGNVSSTEYATRVNFSATAGGYNAWTMTSTGKSALQSALGGTFKMALRSSFDIDNSAPGSGTSSLFEARAVGFSGTLSDPYIALTVLALSEPAVDSWAWRDTAEPTLVHSGVRTSGRAATDTWAWSDSVAIYGRLRAAVTIVPEGSNTTINGSQNPSSGTITVASTSGFDSSGSAYIMDTTNEAASYPQAKFEYTSKDSTHFYGCTSGSAEFNQTFADGSSVGTLLNESHFPQIQVLDSTSTPELLVTYHVHAAHSAANGTVRGRRSTDGGITWGSEFTVAEPVGRPGGVTGRRPGVYGHTMFRMSDGTLFLAWYEHKLDFENVETYTKYSTDNGATWSTPIKVPNQYVGSNLMGQSTGCGIVEYGGYLYVMVYGWDGTNYARTPDDSYVKLLKTNDLGVSWTTVATVAKGGYNGADVRGYNETSLVILADGTWVAQHRAEVNATTGFNNLDRYQSVSTDHGVTWSTPTRVIQKFANTPTLWQMPDGTILSQGMNADLGRTVGSGYPITFFTADYNNWISSNYRAETVDATYTQLNGSDFENVTASSLTPYRKTVNAYAMERTSQAGAQVKFQWYNIPGFYLAADAWAWSDSVARDITYGRTTSDAWAWTDTQPLPKTSADSWAWSDAVTASLAAPRTTSDAWAWSESITGTRIVVRRGTDAWAWSDAVTGAASWSRATSDTLTWSDTADGQRVTLRTPADAWAWSDTATRLLADTGTTADSWAWLDAATGLHSVAVATSDTWLWTDSPTGSLQTTPGTYSRTTGDVWLWVDAATETHGATPLPARVFIEHYAYPDTNGEHYAYPLVKGSHYPYPKVYAKHGPTEGA